MSVPRFLCTSLHTDHSVIYSMEEDLTRCRREKTWRSRSRPSAPGGISLTVQHRARRSRGVSDQVTVTTADAAGAAGAVDAAGAAGAVDAAGAAGAVDAAGAAGAVDAAG